MQIFVTRHTQLAVGRETCYGQSNIAVADTFDAEAAEIKTKLTQQFDAIFCSPLDRCKKLAATIAAENVSIEKRLIEFNFGDWENKLWNDIEPEVLNIWMQDFVNIPTPNGENVIALYNRVCSFIDELRTKKYENVLLITHAGVIRCLWVYLLGMPIQNMFKIPIGFGEIFMINLGETNALDAIKQKQ